MTHTEALQLALDALSLALSDVDWRADSPTQPVIHKAYNACKRALSAPAAPEPVASVTECEACFTPDVCQLRGTCDHYSAQRLRVARATPAAHNVQRRMKEQSTPAAVQARNIKAVARSLVLVAKSEPPNRDTR